MFVSLAVLLCCAVPVAQDAPVAPTVRAAPWQAFPRVTVSADTIPIALVLADRLYNGWARASIVRPRGEGPDIIIVSHETTVADLAKAVGMLLESRVDAEPPLSNDMRAHVSASEAEPEQSELLDVLAEGLERLPQAAPANVPDYGVVPRLIIEVPVEPGPDVEDVGVSPDSSPYLHVAGVAADPSLPVGLLPTATTTGRSAGVV